MREIVNIVPGKAGEEFIEFSLVSTAEDMKLFEAEYDWYLQDEADGVDARLEEEMALLYQNQPLHPQPDTCRKRFKQMSEDELVQLERERDEKGTLQVTAWAVKILKGDETL